MTIKNLYPTSRPTLDLNFAQTKRLDPRVTFSRGSTGTYFDANGVLQSAATNTARFDHNPATGESLGLLVEESRANLATYSEHFDNAAWTKTNIAVTPNSALAPDNTFTADLIAGNGASGNHWLFNNTNDSSAGTRTYSIYAKANTHNFIQVLFSGDGGPYANFNLSTGVVGNTGTSTTASIQAVGNGWYRCIVYTSSASATTPYVALVSSATAIRAESNSLSTSVYLWAAQSEFSASFPTSYIPTPATFTSRASTATYYDANGVIQTAASNVARSAAYFPDSNGVMRPAGLLLEAAGTNLMTYSEQFDNAAWTKANATITANAAVAPDGATTADKIVEDNTTAFHVAFDGFSAAASTRYSFSVYVKAAERSWAQFALGPSTYFGGVGVSAYFNLTSGTVGTVTSNATALSSATMQKLPNGWYLCTLTATTNAASGGANAYIRIANADGGASYLGDGSSGIYIWGAQLEASPYATSYIPTTTATVTRSADVSSSATVTRSADVASITGTNFSSWYNQSEGTFLMVESASQVPQTNTHRLEIYRNGAANTDCIAHVAGTSSNFTRLVGRSSSSNTTLDVSANTTWSTTRGARAIALKQDNCALARGSSSATDTSSVFPQNLDALGFGSPANTFQSNAVGMNTLARLTYWPTRLSDATLQAITL